MSFDQIFDLTATVYFNKKCEVNLLENPFFLPPLYYYFFFPLPLAQTRHLISKSARVMNT